MCQGRNVVNIYHSNFFSPHMPDKQFFPWVASPTLFFFGMYVYVCPSVCLGGPVGVHVEHPPPRARIIGTDCYALPFMWVLIWTQVFRLGQQELFSCIFFFALHRVSLSCPHCCSLTHSVGPGRPWTCDLLLCLLSNLHSTFFEHSVHRSPINRNSFGY